MVHRENGETVHKNHILRPILPIIIALYILFFLLFSGIVSTGFWAIMSAGVFCITVFCFILDPCYLDYIGIDVRSGVFQKLLLGVGSALVLYGIFFLGNVIFRSVLPQSSAFIDSVYALGTDRSPAMLIILLSCVIGPGEELIWRGYLQRHIGFRLNPRYALLTSIFLYTIVHLPSGNPMLLLAALICGVTWSLIYYVSGSILINVVSHSLWDVMVFVLYPY